MLEIRKENEMEKEIAVIEQMPKITDKIKEIGANLNERLEKLNLDELVCSEETRKSIADLRSSLNKEKTEFEKQRKAIKDKILVPYEVFTETYNTEIKERYDVAIKSLDEKIEFVELEIKENIKLKMNDFFEEYRSFMNIPEEYLKFEELNLKIGINQLTPKGELIKKVKDEIKNKINNISNDIESIKSMQNSDEILVEYLKNKNLSLAIKEVNDRHLILEQVQRNYEVVEEERQQEEKIIEKVEEILQAPVEEELKGQMTIDDFAESNQLDLNEELLETKFKVITTRENLEYLVKVMKERGMKYESITD